MKRGFSLIELIFAITLLSLLILFTLPSLGSTHLHINKISDQTANTLDAVNLMEANLAGQSYKSKRFHTKVTSLDDEMELVEVISNDTEKTVLQSYRPKEGIYLD